MATQRYSAKDMIYAIEEAGGVVVDAAKILGCSPSTVYNYAERYVTVQDAIEATRTGLYEEAHEAVIAMVRDPTHRNHRWAVERILRTYGQHVSDGLDWTNNDRSEDHAEEESGQDPVVFEWPSIDAEEGTPNGK